MTLHGIEIGTSIEERTPVVWPWRRHGTLSNGLIEGPVGSGKSVLLRRIAAAAAAEGWGTVHYDASRPPWGLEALAATALVPQRATSAAAPLVVCIDAAEYLGFDGGGPALLRLARDGAGFGVAVIAAAAPGALDGAVGVDGVAAALSSNHVAFDHSHPHVSWTGTANGVATVFHPAADCAIAPVSGGPPQPRGTSGTQ